MPFVIRRRRRRRRRAVVPHSTARPGPTQLAAVVALPQRTAGKKSRHIGGDLSADLSRCIFYLFLGNAAVCLWTEAVCSAKRSY